MLISTLHSFVNIFAGGRSEIKTVIFILYLALLMVVHLLFRQTKPRSLKWRWFGLALAAMYIYGLALQIFYILSNNLSWTDYFITGNNQEISSSTIWHSHIAKAVIGQIFSLAGRTRLETMDAGSAYLGIIPCWVFLLGAVILIVLICQAILFFSTSFRSMLAGRTRRQQYFLILSYAIVSFSLIKTSIDGGLLTSSFVIGLFFIIALIARQRGKLAINYYYLAVLLGALLLFISLYLDHSGNNNGLLLATVAAQLILCVVILYGSEEQIDPWFLTIFLVLFVASWWVASARDRDIYSYSQISLSPGKEIYFYSENDREVETLKIEQTRSIAQIIQKLGRNISYLPVTVPGLTCMKNAPYHKFSVDLISSSRILANSLLSSHFMKIYNRDSVRHGKRWQTALTIFFHPCLPEGLSVIDGELKKNNIDNYLLVNPLFYDSLDAN